MKLSVIVPVYNTEKYIEKCLDSLVNQTLKEMEIIVINDGSTDHSKEIIEKYQKKYKQLRSYHLENKGVSYARNFGITKAQGKYITFLDSDDYIDENLYEQMLKQDADVIECDFIWEYERKKVYDYRNQNIHSLLGMRAVVWNRLYRRELFEKHDLTFPYGLYYEDVEFCYRLFPYIKTFAYVPNVYVHYVQREGSITSQKSQKLRDIYKVLENTIEYYKKNNFYDTYDEELEYLYMRYILGSSFKRIVKIDDKKLRNEMLNEGYQKLLEKYPNYKKNKYLKEKTKKNIYFKSVNSFTYKIYSVLFRIIKK